MNERLRLIVALMVIAATIYLMARRFDVRLILLGAGLVLASVAGTPLTIPDTFARAMVSAMVGPICLSMGFAAVLAATGCDQHLARLLLVPLRRAGGALLPGGILCAYLVNLAVPSQTSTAAAVGPILMPLLLTAGVQPAKATAALLLGASFGGDLLNPAAQDIHAIAGTTELSARDLHARLVPAGLVGVVVAAVATLVRWPSPPALDLLPELSAPPQSRISLVKALIPLVPVTLLLLAYAGLPGLGWLVQVPTAGPLAGLGSALPVVRAVLIGAALAIGVHLREAQPLSRQFFADIGMAYGNIITLTITAQCFGAGLAALGIGKLLLAVIGGSHWGLNLVAIVFPWALAVLSGSGSGPILTFAETFLHEIVGEGDRTTLAALACLAGACGRTMSPVSAVALYCSGLVRIPPLRLVSVVLPALLVGTLVSLLVVLLGVRLP